MSMFSTAKAESFLHHLRSLLDGQRAYGSIHSIGVFLFFVKVPPLFRVLLFLVVRMVGISSNYSSHFPVVVVKFGGPFVPVVKVSGWNV